MWRVNNTFFGVISKYGVKTESSRPNVDVNDKIRATYNLIDFFFKLRGNLNTEFARMNNHSYRTFEWYEP